MKEQGTRNSLKSIDMVRSRVQSVRRIPSIAAQHKLVQIAAIILVLMLGAALPMTAAVADPPPSVTCCTNLVPLLALPSAADPAPIDPSSYTCREFLGDVANAQNVAVSVVSAEEDGRYGITRVSGYDNRIVYVAGYISGYLQAQLDVNDGSVILRLKDLGKNIKILRDGCRGAPSALALDILRDMIEGKK